jgi:hypothetical protein
MADATQALKSITPKLREQLHISGINMMSECGKRFEFRYVLGIRDHRQFSCTLVGCG